MLSAAEGRHPSTQEKARFLEANPNLSGDAEIVAVAFEQFADGLIEMVPDGPQFTIALQKLLEAKDCAVRAVL